ncbi:3-phenylpropionate-dihydrodiol/cinnamic acid-dihydrodiol dehydrogenase [bioreactor metagenome]|uniref:3-phenylpropionate-dihydrodiol/cinnamic acid-dihydrodiol dehydrogenase n=1 Tax=bioreactor metagenome TaxID=1076179 RepID=A0A645A047_9ZZZZ
MRPFTPDHIVYCRAFPLFIERGSTDDETAFLLKKAFEAYAEDYGYKPKVIAVTGLGFFICNNSKKNADIVKSLLIDSIKIAYYAACFSHPRNMSDELCEFIIGWEAESYRAGLSEKGAHRLSGKVAIITGSAQGFGKGIAERLAAEGAYTVIADINYEGASICSQQINEKYKYAFALPVKVNVTDEKSVESMIKTTVMNFGGIDIFINNAGIVRAGSLDEMSFESFSLVTGINYSAYFLCAKYASKVMKRQYEFAPDYYTDIIEINSKSGLTGSNKNFAYAGSKFGGIGLTQSFALELVQYNIKVNAICPGNFFEGPLWSDPEKGLFIQYLKAGKVPGANSVEDVKKYYEEKIPMKRGCRPEDVVKAILYIIDQKYETGQALPVTGGQVMLN